LLHAHCEWRAISVAVIGVGGALVSESGHSKQGLKEGMVGWIDFGFIFYWSSTECFVTFQLARNDSNARKKIMTIHVGIIVIELQGVLILTLL
jgi:hypothetical protein